jgi:FKBP-type peptidyl-prolyl cis-trans isomerase FkpA
MRHGILLLFVALVIHGCGGPFPGFKEVNSEVHYRLHTIGDGDRLPTDSDSVFVRVRVAGIGKEAGSLFSTEAWYSSLKDVLPEEALPALQLRMGDSATVRLRGARFPWIAARARAPQGADSLWLDVEVALLGLRSRAESRALAQERLFARTASDEERILTTYLKASDQLWKEFMGVRYSLLEPVPRTPVIQSGQTVCMHYTAHFLDTGVLFDDTHRGGHPLTFRLGDPGQVIKGLEIAAHVLPDGGKGRFIIPSEHAFGADGSSSGIVPPFTPVLYTIEAWVPVADSVASVH